MSSVLVTGGTGFIGAWVTRQLVEQGVKVVTYSRNPDFTFLRDIADKVDCVAGDVLDLPGLIHAIKQYRVERVVHLSTQLISALEANPFFGYRVNVDGAMNVLEASRLMGVKRVVYISSRAVYDVARGEYAHPTYKPIDEDYPKSPRNVYGATKLFVENMGLNYNRIYGLDFIALRFAVTWGPGKQARHAFLAVNSIVEAAMRGEALTFTYDLDQLDDMLYVKDIANGIALACFADNLQHRIFHLGMGKGVSIRHVMEVVNKIFGKVPIEVCPSSTTTGLSAHFVFNIDRARKELGYTPHYDIEAAIRDYIEVVKSYDTKSAKLL